MKNMWSFFQQSFIYLPSPSNLSMWWNLGFLLGMVLVMQISTGLFLSLHYNAQADLAFSSIIHISHNVNYGWLLQIMHMNGASLFFILIYLHIARGIYYSLYKNMPVWVSGFFILLFLMLSAFLGYVLPWGQMSFWGATVITNLLSALPYMGQQMVFWIWGGFSINTATLTRFFIFHFLFPLLIMVFVVFHLLFLHEKGSQNPLGSSSNFDKISFYPYFLVKDLFFYMIILSGFFFICFFLPYLFCDHDNFMPANPMVTPIHIQPEWYFLFAYAILRSIPSKLGGVLALLMSLMVLLILPFFHKNYLSKNFNFLKNSFWMWCCLWILLTFLGAMPVEAPFLFMSQMVAIFYFTMVLFL